MKSTRSARPSWRSTGRKSLVTPTCEPLTRQLWSGSRSLSVARPASPPPSPDDARVAQTSDGCGRSSSESQAGCDHVGSWLRTRLASLLIPTQSPSLHCWTRRATKSLTRSCWVLAQWEAWITATASGWWPTPRAGESKQGRSSTRNRALAAAKAGRKPDWMLSDAVRFGGPHDPDILSSSGRTDERLNPRWVASLMGFPPGWLDVSGERLTSLWGTRSTRQSRRSSPERSESQTEP